MPIKYIHIIDENNFVTGKGAKDVAAQNANSLETTDELGILGDTTSYLDDLRLSKDSTSSTSNYQAAATLDTIDLLAYQDRIAFNFSNSVKESQPVVLYISPNLPDYDTSSGGKRATRMVGLIAEEATVYAYTRGQRQQKYIDKLNSLGVNVIQHYDYAAIKNHIPQVDVIIYAWYYTCHESAKLMDLYPNAKIILDSVDIHWVRESRSIGLMEGLTEEIVAKNKTSEVAAYNKADVVWGRNRTRQTSST